MNLVSWKDEYSVGVPDVDHEHREMIELINELDHSMSEEVSHDTVVEALGEIYANIAAHFALEERIMRRARYVDYEVHKQDHETLLDDLLDVIDSVDEEGRYDRAALSRDLNVWFSDHFRTHDAKLHHMLG